MRRHSSVMGMLLLELALGSAITTAIPSRAQGKCDPTVTQHPPMINALRHWNGRPFSPNLEELESLLKEDEGYPYPASFEQVSRATVGFECNGERYVAVKHWPMPSDGVDVTIYKIDPHVKAKTIGCFTVNSAEPLAQDQADALLSEESWAKIRAGLAVRHHPPPFGCRRRPVRKGDAAQRQ